MSIGPTIVLVIFGSVFGYIGYRGLLALYMFTWNNRRSNRLLKYECELTYDAGPFTVNYDYKVALPDRSHIGLYLKHPNNNPFLSSASVFLPMLSFYEFYTKAGFLYKYSYKPDGNKPPLVAEDYAVERKDVPAEIQELIKVVTGKIPEELNKIERAKKHIAEDLLAAHDYWLDSVKADIYGKIADEEIVKLLEEDKT